MPLEQDPVVAAYDAVRNVIYGADRATEVEVTAAFRGLNFLLDEVNRLSDDIAAKGTESAALRTPVMEWRGDVGTVGSFHALLSALGWVLFIPTDNGGRMVMGLGPETGTVGKAACVAAYLKAIGIPSPHNPVVP